MDFKNMLTVVSCLFFLLSGCASSNKSYCKHYDFGTIDSNAYPSGSTPSSKPIKGVVAEDPSVIESVKNLEKRKMTLSYTPVGGKVITATIGAGSTSDKFKGAFGKGSVSIERDQSFITGRDDGADVEFCFSRPSSTATACTSKVFPNDLKGNKTPFSAVKIPEAWSYFNERWQTKTPNTTGWPAVLVVDDGFFYHPDIGVRPKLYKGFPGTTSEGRELPLPAYGFHGTGVASLIGAIRDNKIGIPGIAGSLSKGDRALYGGVELIPARAGGTFVPGGTGMSPSSLADAILYWLNRSPRLRIINISQSVVKIDRHDKLYKAFKRAESKGVLIVLGAGNDKKVRNKRGGRDWLSGFDNIIIVGGLSHDGSELWIEDDNKSKGTATGASIDIWAPAEDLQVITSGGKIEKVSGTSFATPMVSAVAALILNVKPSLTAGTIRDIMLRSAQTITLKNGAKIKRLDACKALQLAERPLAMRTP